MTNNRIFVFPFPPIEAPLEHSSFRIFDYVTEVEAVIIRRISISSWCAPCDFRDAALSEMCGFTQTYASIVDWGLEEPEPEPNLVCIRWAILLDNIVK